MNSRGNQLKLISICIPIMNEQENLVPLIGELQALADRNKKQYRFEFVFTDNASTDMSWDLLQDLSAKEERIKAFRFSRNVGFQNSILFNYLQSRGDAVIQLDADLQDPPSLVDDFIREWENGFLVVSGIRVERKEGRLLNNFRRFGYWFINKVSENPILRDAGDFRLIDRKVVNQLRDMKTPNPYIRGVISSMAYPEKLINYKRQERARGESKFGLSNLIKLGVTALANHSKLPFKVMNTIGMSAIVFSFISFVYIFILRASQTDLPRGFSSIFLISIFGIGLNAIMLSVIGSYVRKLYVILNGEPAIIVRDVIGIGKEKNLEF